MPKIGIPTCEFAVARRDFAKLLCKPPFGSIDVKLNIDALLLPSGTLYTRIMPGDPDQPTTVTIRGDDGPGRNLEDYKISFADGVEGRAERLVVRNINEDFNLTLLVESMEICNYNIVAMDNITGQPEQMDTFLLKWLISNKFIDSLLITRCDLPEDMDDLILTFVEENNWRTIEVTGCTENGRFYTKSFISGLINWWKDCPIEEQVKGRTLTVELRSTQNWMNQFSDSGVKEDFGRMGHFYLDNEAKTARMRFSVDEFGNNVVVTFHRLA